MRANIYLDNSEISGKGVFSGKEFSKGEIICFAKGNKINIEKIMNKYGADKRKRGNLLQIDSKEYLELQYPFIFINHSCNPNSAVVDSGKLIAIKEIEKGEEISYDYSTTIYENQKDWQYKLWTMKCNCKAGNCRGIISQFYQLPVELQERYIENKFVQDFILIIESNRA